CGEQFGLCRPCYRGTKYCEPCRKAARRERQRGYRRRYAASLRARLVRVARNARARAKKSVSNETDPGLTFSRAAMHPVGGEPVMARQEQDDGTDLVGPVPERGLDAHRRDTSGGTDLESKPVSRPGERSSGSASA